MLTSPASGCIVIRMPKKKAAKSAATHISFRLKPAELEPLDADRKALPGVPVARNTYAKHAVQQYPKLRKLVERLAEDAKEARAAGVNSADPQSGYAAELLAEAGL